MIKNTAGQKIGAEMVSATDGSAFTGSVTVYVTGDAGTQAVNLVSRATTTGRAGNGTTQRLRLGVDRRAIQRAIRRAA